MQAAVSATNLCGDTVTAVSPGPCKSTRQQPAARAAAAAVKAAATAAPGAASKQQVGFTSTLAKGLGEGAAGASADSTAGALEVQTGTV